MSTNRIIGQIYDAALNPELWISVLERVAAYTHCKSAIFTAIDQLNPEYDFTYTYNIPDEALQAYQEERIQVIDMRLHAPIMLEAGIGEPTLVSWKHYVDIPNTDEYLFYEKCLKPTGVNAAHGILLENGKFRWAVFATHRSIDGPDITQQDLLNIKFISDHLRRALQIHRQITILKQEKQQAYNILDYLKIGVLILDHESSVVYSNQKAKTILDKSQLLGLDNFNRLKTINKDQALLNTYILGALFRTSTVQESLPVGGVMGLVEPKEQKPLMLSIVPLSKVKYLDGTITDEQKVAIFLTEPNRHHHLATAYLKQMYKLSNREIQVCELFVNNYNLKEIAQQCSIAYESVRAHFKSIYEKTECSSQIELMRLLMGITVDFEHIA